MAIGAVRRALDHAQATAASADVSAKGVRDAVTSTDLAVEDAVRAMLGDELSAVVVGEERGGDPGSGPLGRRHAPPPLHGGFGAKPDPVTARERGESTPLSATGHLLQVTTGKLCPSALLQVRGG